MTTFTTEDREALEKGLDFFKQLNGEDVEASPPHIVNSESSVQLYKDLEFPGFKMRFIKQGDDWVCTLPNWLMDLAVIMANGFKEKGK